MSEVENTEAEQVNETEAPAVEAPETDAPAVDGEEVAEAPADEPTDVGTDTPEADANPES